MKSRTLRIASALCMLVASLSAYAAQRTFVSSTGNDGNPCSLTLPCRGFAAAVAQTNYAGEVVVLDSAGYGPVSITQTVSIIAPPGVFAGITVAFPNVNGVTVDGVAAIVILHGLTINGQGAPLLHNGIQFTQGSKLTVEDCEISGFPIAGIFVIAPNSNVVVRNTVMHENSGGFGAIGLVTATLDHVRIDGGNGGVGASNGAHVTVTDSVLTNNATDAVGSSASPGTTTKVMVSRTTIVGTGLGLMATAEATGTAILVSDANVFNEITFAAFYFPGLGGTETIYSYGNNKIGPDIVAELGGSATSIGLH